MQCFIIFDHLNDVVFVKGNAKFESYIRKQCIKDGLLRQEEGFRWQGTMEYHNILIQFFSPMIASQRIMVSQIKSPYTGIKCEDGTILAFCECLGYVFIGIGEGVHMSESLLHRKLKIFCRLATFVCGPSLDILKTPGEPNEKCIMLSQLVDTWDFLYHNELVFLLEAQERLLTNADLSTLWVKLLQDVLEKVRSGLHDMTACHAFILIKTKILALYSRNVGVISEGDIICLIILACAQYPDLLPEAVNQNRPSEHSSQLSTPHSSDSERFYSPSGSPDLGCDSPNQSAPPIAELCEEVINKMANIVVEDAEPQETRVQDVEEIEGYVDISADFICNLVFLFSAPHLVYNINISSGVVLVIVCKVNKHDLSGRLACGIEVLHDILNQSYHPGSKLMSEVLDANMHNIIECFRKQKHFPHDVDQLVRRLQTSWTSIKKSGILEWLRSKDSNDGSARLDRALMELSICLKQCFNKLCVAWYHKETEINGSLIDAQAIVRYTLADYIDYLQVKAQRNISMASYYADFPGMVHFMFIDRATNQITAPALDLGENNPNSPLYGAQHRSVIWHKVYDMVEEAWSHLKMGHTAVVWRDECFHYSYFIWFEDPKGNPRKPDVSGFPLDSLPLPGTICGNFFRHYTQECFPSYPDYIHCYELFCIHLTTVPPLLVNQQARRLTATIWEVSGASQSPLDLLL